MATESVPAGFVSVSSEVGKLVAPKIKDGVSHIVGVGMVKVAPKKVASPTKAVRIRLDILFL